MNAPMTIRQATDIAIREASDIAHSVATPAHEWWGETYDGMYDFIMQRLIRNALAKGQT